MATSEKRGRTAEDRVTHTADPGFYLWKLNHERPSEESRSLSLQFSEMMESERPTLSTLFPLSLFPPSTEYFIISDPEEDEEVQELRSEESSDKPKKNKHRRNSGKQRRPQDCLEVSENVDDAIPSDVELAGFSTENRTPLKEKLSDLKKDISNFLSNPTNGILGLIRRREGYGPPTDCKRWHDTEPTDEIKQK